MKSNRLVVAGAVVLVCVSIAAPIAAPAMPQAVAQQSLAEAKAAGVTLKLTVVISRFNGEKKIGSLPYSVMVIPGGSDRPSESTTLQMGAEVPVPSTTLGDGGKTIPSYQYRSVGTSLSVNARTLEAGAYNVSLTVTDSQVMTDPPGAGAIQAPRFLSFTSKTGLLLRDGQTVQYTAATDKTSGDVVRLDVTMNVIK